MKFEKKYTNNTSSEKIKKYGQFFTPYNIADFMINWILEVKPKSILDPAIGNGVFFRNINSSNIKLTGYEIDPDIYNYFKDMNNINYNVLLKDYLVNGWDNKYDGIICNPPYNRFQMIDNREIIRDTFSEISGIKIDGYTNLYIMFLIKSIFQLNDGGRLAYIIPTEFMNSGYGEQIKQMLLKRKILKAIIGFDDNVQVFDNALTTACIILIENKKHDKVNFVTVRDTEHLNEKDLSFILDNNETSKRTIPYETLNASEKWEQFFQPEDVKVYNNLIDFSKFAKAKRGIATGDNSYFVFNKSKKEDFKIHENNLIPCITRSADINTVIFNQSEFNLLKENDKNVFIFDGLLYENKESKNYIKYGEDMKVNEKYLTRNRRVWYMSEFKEPGDILLSVFSRDKLKVVRNLANVRNLTTFHSIYINEDKKEYTNILFCYLLTPIAQEILFRNRRVYGGGLIKFEPNDINKASILDFNVMTDTDINNVLNIYNLILENGINDELLNELNMLFISYLE